MGGLKDGIGAGTGLSGIEESTDVDKLVTGTNKIYFYDSAIYIYSSTDGQLDLVADTAIKLTTLALNYGTSGSPIVLTAGTPTVAIYTTCAGTSGSTSAEPFYLKSTLTGAGQVGGRARFHCYSNVASGGWVNALKAYMEFGASGSASGLGSGLCAEIVMSAGTSSGTYAALEAEIDMGASGVCGTNTSFLYCNVAGAAATTFDTNGCFLEIGTGITPAAGKFASATSQTLKCKVESNTRYLVLSQMEDGLGLGNSSTSMDLGTSTTQRAIDVYTTSSSVDTGTSIRPIYMKSTMTGAGGVGGRAEFHLYTNVGLGSWSNALKGYAEYGSSGYTTGMGSAVCAEIKLNAGTTQGTYAPLESEVVVGASGSLGTATSFLYCNCDTTGQAAFNAGAFLFELGSNVNAGSGSLFDSTCDTNTPQIDHSLKVKVDGGTYYIPLMDNANGG